MTHPKDEALKLALDDLIAEYQMETSSFAKRVNEIFKQALAAQPPVQPVAFLANGTRFKISYDSRQSGGQIHGIPPELGGRWVAFVAAEDDCHLKLATPPAQPAVQEPVALHAMAKRRVFDAIRGAYDLGYNDARSARAVHGDSAPGYKGRDVEADHGGALFSALVRYTTPPAAQPAPVQEPVALGQEREAFEAWHDSFFVNKGHAAHHRFHDRDGYCIDDIQNQWKGWKERAKRTTPPAAPVQEPVAWMHEWDDGERVPMLRKRDVDSSDIDSPKSVRPLVFGDTTPPAAQPAVPDAIHHTDLSEHPQYIEGWNDCRAEMLKGMK
jgi:hypothetical protein